MDGPLVLSFGDMLWDEFPDGPRFGGAAANFACNAARLGARVRMCSAVGRDERGDAALARLRAYGVSADLVQRSAQAPTGTVGVTLDAEGRPSFEIRAGAWDAIEWRPELEAALAEVQAVGFGTLGQRGAVSRATAQRLLDRAGERGVVRLLDVNVRRPEPSAQLVLESLARADLVKVSDEELPVVARACGLSCDDPVAAVRALREQHELDLVALTLGARGAVLVTAEREVHQTAFPVTVVDTVGAGDAFSAALLLGWLRGDPLETIARHACSFAAASCSHAGALPPLMD